MEMSPGDWWWVPSTRHCNLMVPADWGWGHQQEKRVSLNKRVLGSNIQNCSDSKVCEPELPILFLGQSAIRPFFLSCFALWYLCFPQDEKKGGGDPLDPLMLGWNMWDFCNVYASDINVYVGYKTEKFTLPVLHLTVLVRVTVLVR